MTPFCFIYVLETSKFTVDKFAVASIRVPIPLSDKFDHLYLFACLQMKQVNSWCKVGHVHAVFIYTAQDGQLTT
jgi:hypothetical protein